MKQILSLDLGTKCGWALNRGPGGAFIAGVLDLSSNRFEGGGMRYLTFRIALNKLLMGVDLVVFEEVRNHSRKDFTTGKVVFGIDAAHVYGGLLAILTSECEARESKIPYQGVQVGEIKRIATGKGNANKAAMLAAAQEKWGAAAVRTDDQADALWLLEWAVRRYNA